MDRIEKAEPSRGIADCVRGAKPLGGELFMGVDIGTTSISAAVTDGSEARTFSIANGCDLPSAGVRREQDASALAERARLLIDALLEVYPGVAGIGFDGQMHGIIYVDGEGNALSPLATWQDGRADLPSKNGESACGIIRRAAGYPAYAGYGLATHLANLLNGETPDGASSICTAADYAVMRLCGMKRPVVHVTNAASFGLFDIRALHFDTYACREAGIDPAVLPRVTDSVLAVGSYRAREIFTAVGDNQAAYLGVMPDGGVLCNFGTGSQICFSDDSYREVDGMECRPYFGGRYLYSGSALCGGRAYSILERFFREYEGTNEPQYARLDALCEQGYESGVALDVETLFCGTRADPTLRGSVTGIGEDNFTPQAMAYGFIRGMVNELYGYYRLSGLPDPDSVTVSGNAARRSRVLPRVTADVFGAPVAVSEKREEAACGAAAAAMKTLGRG